VKKRDWAPPGLRARRPPRSAGLISKKIEEAFQTGKELTGLDEHQVRRWTSWHRWVTLAMLAQVFLIVATAAQRRASRTTTTLIA
jgi:SRSO17 transposase